MTGLFLSVAITTNLNSLCVIFLGFLRADYHFTFHTYAPTLFIWLFEAFSSFLRVTSLPAVNRILHTVIPHSSRSCFTNLLSCVIYYLPPRQATLLSWYLFPGSTLGVVTCFAGRSSRR